MEKANGNKVIRKALAQKKPFTSVDMQRMVGDKVPQGTISSTLHYMNLAKVLDRLDEKRMQHGARGKLIAYKVNDKIGREAEPFERTIDLLRKTHAKHIVRKKTRGMPHIKQAAKHTAVSAPIVLAPRRDEPMLDYFRRMQSDIGKLDELRPLIASLLECVKGIHELLEK